MQGLRAPCPACADESQRPDLIHTPRLERTEAHAYMQKSACSCTNSPENCQCGSKLKVKQRGGQNVTPVIQAFLLNLKVDSKSLMCFTRVFLFYDTTNFYYIDIGGPVEYKCIYIYTWFRVFADWQAWVVVTAVVYSLNVCTSVYCWLIDV